MKTIRVGFSTRSCALPWVIRKATASRVSHTYIRIPVPEHSTSMIFQASGLNVNYCNGELFDSHNDIIEEYDVDISDEQFLISEKFRVTESGKPYSSKQLVGFLTVLAARRILGKHISNPSSDGNHSYICVEIVAVCLGLGNAESMTPEDLRRWCAKNARLIYSKAIQ